MEKWTIESLKEYFERILEEKDKALTAALIAVKEENRKTETAAEKRFELLNELRGDVATKAELQALEKVLNEMKSRADTMQGKGLGTTAALGYILAAITIVGFLLSRFA